MNTKNATIVRNVALYALFAVSIILLGCQTQSLSSKVSLGMTKNQVLGILGAPYRQVARFGENGARLEALHYREKKADATDTYSNIGNVGRGRRNQSHGGIYSSTSNTILTHIFLFKNGILVEIKEGNSEYGGRNSGQWWW